MPAGYHRAYAFPKGKPAVPVFGKRKRVIEKPPHSGLSLLAESVSEAAIQKAILGYLRIAVPECFPWHVTNGGERSDGERIRNSQMGAVAGVPDIQVILPAGQVIWLEIKKPNGSLSLEQRGFHSMLESLGHSVAVVRSIDETRRALRRFGVETREAA